MKPFVGYVSIKKMQPWRGLEFYGIAFLKRWYVGFVRFDHRRDPPRLKP